MNGVRFYSWFACAVVWGHVADRAALMAGGGWLSQVVGGTGASFVVFVSGYLLEGSTE